MDVCVPGGFWVMFNTHVAQGGPTKNDPKMSPSLDQQVCDKDEGLTCLKTVGAQNIPPAHYSPYSSGIKTLFMTCTSLYHLLSLGLKLDGWREHVCCDQAHGLYLKEGENAGIRSQTLFSVKHTDSESCGILHPKLPQDCRSPSGLLNPTRS